MKYVPCLENLQIAYCVNYRDYTWLLHLTKRIIVPVAATWPSEGFFHGQPKRFFQKGSKVVKFNFTRSKLKNKPCFLKI